MNFQTTIDGNKLDIDLTSTIDAIHVKYNKTKKIVDCVPIGPNSFSLLLNGNTHYISIIPQKNSYHVTVDYQTYTVEIKDTLEILLEEFGLEKETNDHARNIHAEIPGLVNQIFVKKGDKVHIGDKLCILEAMKMENEITSLKEGIINKIHIKVGSHVLKDELLMEITD